MGCSSSAPVAGVARAAKDEKPPWEKNLRSVDSYKPDHKDFVKFKKEQEEERRKEEIRIKQTPSSLARRASTERKNFALNQRNVECEEKAKMYVEENLMEHGDWICRGCHHKNSRDRDFCLRCKAPRVTDQVGHRGGPEQKVGPLAGEKQTIQQETAAINIQKIVRSFSQRKEQRRNKVALRRCDLQADGIRVKSNPAAGKAGKSSPTASKRASYSHSSSAPSKISNRKQKLSPPARSPRRSPRQSPHERTPPTSPAAKKGRLKAKSPKGSERVRRPGERFEKPLSRHDSAVKLQQLVRARAAKKEVQRRRSLSSDGQESF